MNKNYLKIAFGNLWRYRIFSFIHVNRPAFRIECNRTSAVITGIKTPAEVVENWPYCHCNPLKGFAN